MTATLLAARALLRLSSPSDAAEVRDFLQGLITNDVALATPRTPIWAALLTAQGKVLFDFILWADGDDILIDCEADQADALARRLTLYRLRRKVDIARDESLSVHWSLNSGDIADPRLPALGHRWVAPAVAGDPADAAWLAHRLSLGVTEGVAELGSDATLWLECNAAELNGVSFRKGCYIGQENTARMNWRQKVNRRLVVVPIAQADERRQRAAYPHLGLSVEHRRIEDLAGLDLPGWLADALAKGD